jgi:hypothetical protein
MTDAPDDLPSPDEFRWKVTRVEQEFADARRYLSALSAQDNQALGALIAEIHRSGRAMKVLAAMAPHRAASRLASGPYDLRVLIMPFGSRALDHQEVAHFIARSRPQSCETRRLLVRAHDSNSAEADLTR